MLPGFKRNNKVLYFSPATLKYSRNQTVLEKTLMMGEQVEAHRYLGRILHEGQNLMPSRISPPQLVQNFIGFRLMWLK